jgi:hypothetical protein
MMKSAPPAFELTFVTCMLVRARQSAVADRYPPLITTTVFFRMISEQTVNYHLANCIPLNLTSLPTPHFEQH